MHELNTSKLIGHDFYLQPQASSAKRLEYIFNKLYGVLPTTVSFSDEFETTCLQDIEKYFELLCADINKVGDRVIEEGVWVGKAETEYAGIFLSVAYKAGEEGEMPFDLHSILFSYQSSRDKKHLMENLYVGVRAACRDRSKAQLVLKLMDKHKLERKSKMYLLSSSYGDLTFTGMPIPEMNMDLALNYGEEFQDFHNTLVKSVNEKNSGLYLFYGKPGTGKSSYIKHLLTGEITRKIAYIPVSLIDRLTHPDMMPLLMENKDIVLVLEDAEKALLSREVSDNATIVSTILNLTDGFIGQALNITIIATFNTEKDKIDEALLRKGRLRMIHEFKKLNVDSCRKIAEKLGIEASEINEEMTLAEIYNYTSETGYKPPEQRRVGFN